MKKLLFVLVFSLVSVCLVLAGGEGEQGKRKITLGSQSGPGEITYDAAEKFKQYIEEMLPNMEVIIYPSSQLGDYRAMTQQLMNGELDLQLIGYPDMSYLIPELKIIGEPFVIKDFDHLKRVVAGPYGKQIEGKMSELGIKFLDVGYFGVRQTTSNVPINSIEDLKGLKLRVPNVDFLLDYAKAVEAVPSPIAFQEVYLALQTNQVDAQENPLPTIDAMKFYEVQKYIAITNHFIASQAIIMNEKRWESLSEKEQEVIMEAARIAAEHQTNETFKKEDSLINTFKERGITVTYPDTEPFRDAMAPYYQKLNMKFGANSVEDIIQY